MKGLLVGRKVCECVEKFKVGNSGVTDNGWEYHFVVQNISASKYVDERELCANWDTVQNFELFFLFFFQTHLCNQKIWLLSISLAAIFICG